MSESEHLDSAVDILPPSKDTDLPIIPSNLVAIWQRDPEQAKFTPESEDEMSNKILNQLYELSLAIRRAEFMSKSIVAPDFSCQTVIKGIDLSNSQIPKLIDRDFNPRTPNSTSTAEDFSLKRIRELVLLDLGYKIDWAGKSSIIWNQSQSATRHRDFYAKAPFNNVIYLVRRVTPTKGNNLLVNEFIVASTDESTVRSNLKSSQLTLSSEVKISNR